MSGIEIIGFVISLISILFLFFKKRIDDTYRQNHPEQIEEEDELAEGDPVRDLLRSLERETEKRTSLLKKPPAPPAPNSRTMQSIATSSSKVKKIGSTGLQSSKSSLEKRQIKSQLEDRRLTPSLREKEEERSRHALTNSLPSTDHSDRQSGKASRAALFIKQLPSLKSIVVYKEIFGKPKGLQ
jgi:hypothetical protein